MINFLGLGIRSNCQAKVKIYDKNKIIYDGMTYDGKVCVRLENKAYKIVASFSNEIIKTVIYGGSCVTLSFNQNSLRTVTFILRDLYYGIPVERGEIVLWQR